MQILTLQMRRVLYAMKRRYGGPITVYKLVSSQTNVRTGEKENIVQQLCLARAVILPGHTARRVLRGISLISANKQMVMGGTFDSKTRDFIIDRRDARNLTDLTASDWIVHKNRRYQIEEVESFECDTAWVITATEFVGEARTPVTLTAGVTGELSLAGEVDVVHE